MTENNIKELNASEINQFNVAFSTAIRCIFGFRQWQSFRQLRKIYGFSSLEVIYDKAKRRFHIGMICHKNNTLRFLAALHREAEEAERN